MRVLLTAALSVATENQKPGPPTGDRFRDRPTSRPEDRLVGVTYISNPVDRDMIVDNASHWVFGGAGLRRGDRLTGLLGYEVDAISSDPPAAIERLAHSPFVEGSRTGTRTRRSRRRRAARWCSRPDRCGTGPGRLQRAGMASESCRRRRAARHAQSADTDARNPRCAGAPLARPKRHRPDCIGDRRGVRHPRVDDAPGP